MSTHTTPTHIDAGPDGSLTVSLSQAGAFDTMAGCERAGIAIVAALHSVEDAEALAASRYGGRVARVVIEPAHRQLARAGAEVVAIDATLRAGGVNAPRLQPDAQPPLALAA